MKEIIQMLSSQLEYISHEVQGGEILIRVRSKCAQSNCPYCGELSGRAHSRYERRLQDLPIQGKKARLVLSGRKYFRDNKQCAHRTFAETFAFFAGKSTKTNRLREEILRVSLTRSSTAAARYLRASVADAGKSTIRNLLKKGARRPVDKSGIHSVCIDDFALKKRQRYGAVMADIHTHKIVDMPESREMEAVRRRLADYPNLRVVSRDGSQTYAAAIAEARPGAIQVSDRFHILKNPTGRATLALQKLFQGRIAIPVTSGTQDIRYDALIGTKPERVQLVILIFF